MFSKVNINILNVNGSFVVFQGGKGSPGAYGGSGDKGRKGVKGTMANLYCRQMWIRIMSV